MISTKNIFEKKSLSLVGCHFKNDSFPTTKHNKMRQKNIFHQTNGECIITQLDIFFLFFLVRFHMLNEVILNVKTNT